MGNCLGDRKEPPTLFDLQDLKNLNETFDYYCDLDEITRKSRQLSERAFEEIFAENPEFGRKLFKLLEIYGKQEKLIKREVLFSILEIFLKDNCLNPELKTFTKLELMSLISLKDTSFIKEKEELHALRITYLDAMKIVNDLLKVRLSDNESYDEIAAKSFLDTIFRNEQLIDWFELIKTLDSEFNQRIIRSYMANKFMRKSLPTLIPQFNTPSYLLNDDQLMLLQMKGKKGVLQTSSKLELIYSNIVHNGGFNQLVKSLVDSQQPTLILLQHEEQYIQQSDQSTIRKQYIFGAVSNTRWFDLGVAVGDDNDFIFSIYPRFEVFASKNDSKRQFQYLNTKDTSKEIGLGFGLGDNNKCRIWLGEDIDDSYCGFEDGTYASGDLVHKHIKKLHINTIEVWGIRQPAEELCETLEPIHVYDLEPIEELNIPEQLYSYEQKFNCQLLLGGGIKDQGREARFLLGESRLKVNLLSTMNVQQVPATKPPSRSPMNKFNIAKPVKTEPSTCDRQFSQDHRIELRKTMTPSFVDDVSVQRMPSNRVIKASGKYQEFLIKDRDTGQVIDIREQEWQKIAQQQQQKRPILSHSKAFEGQQINGFQSKKPTIELNTNAQSFNEEKVGPENFKVHVMIGRGSFGEVYLVEKIDSNQLFALKILQKSKIQKQNLTKYAVTERNVLSQMRHPFIVRLRYAFQTADKLCLIMDYCPGGDLGTHLRKETRFPEERVKLYLTQLILALEDLHKRDIIFRDLKPDNIVLDQEGYAMLTDFGLSKEGVQEQHTGARSFCGSVAYLAPEMLQRSGHGKAVDWYLLGVVMYEMLVGQPPFYANDREELFNNIQKAELKLPNYISPEGVNLLKSLLQRNPAKRLGSGKGDADEIKLHPYFKDIDWRMVYEKKIKMPILSRKTKFIKVEHNVFESGSFIDQSHVAGWSFAEHKF